MSLAHMLVAARKHNREFVLAERSAKVIEVVEPAAACLRGQ